MKHTAPLYRALDKHAEESLLSFHMPVHTPDGPLSKAYGSNRILSFDTTELDTTDNLACPKGCIAEAHRFAAAAYGCHFAHFLVGGSTAGVHTMLLYACHRGDTVLIDRCAHISVLNACMMYGLQPAFIERSILPGTQLVAPLTAQQVEAAILLHPTAKAVLITSPTYYGVNSDLRSIAAVAHRHSMLLLADAAHGSHYAFCASFPESAISAGADLCTVSLHKTLGALTQAALLLANDSAASDARLKMILNMVQTTSPSYLLMSSADLALHDMCANGETLLSNAARHVKAIAARIQAETSFQCLPSPSVNCDPLRFTIGCSKYRISGYALAQVLRGGYGIEVEMADLSYIVCIVGPYVTQDKLERLGAALIEVSHSLPPAEAENPLSAPPPLILRLPPAEAFASPLKYLPLAQCTGKIAAANICIYPPGIPVVVAGCEMTMQNCSYLLDHLALGGEIAGLSSDGMVPVLA